MKDAVEVPQTMTDEDGTASLRSGELGQDLPAQGLAPTEAIEQLRNNQTQLDMDGCMVGVSRQAIEEVLAYVDAPRASDPLRGELVEALRDQAIRPNHEGMYVCCHICGETWSKTRGTEHHKPDCLLAKAESLSPNKEK